MNDLVLASASLRRRDLLASVGIACEVVPSDLVESRREGERPEEHVVRLAIGKAKEVASRRSVKGRWFLGCDTIVVRDGVFMGKPNCRSEAFDMLRMLSGGVHYVYTGYAIYDRETDLLRSGWVVTEVLFKTLNDTEINDYLDIGESFDKAGGYAIQKGAAFMVRQINGSYTNVVGLPLCEVVELLEELEITYQFSNAFFEE